MTVTRCRVKLRSYLIVADPDEEIGEGYNFDGVYQTHLVSDGTGTPDGTVENDDRRTDEETVDSNVLASISLITMGFNATVLCYDDLPSYEHSFNFLNTSRKLFTKLYNELSLTAVQSLSYSVEITCYEVVDTQIKDLLLPNDGKSDGKSGGTGGTSMGTSTSTSTKGYSLREQTDKKVIIDGLSSVSCPDATTLGI